MQRKDAWNAMPCAEGGQGLLSALMTLFDSAWPTQGQTGRKRWWTPTRLAVVLVVMAWHRRFGLVDRFHEARVVLGDPEQPQTYQGLVKAYGRVMSWLWPAAMTRLREAMDAESDVPRPAWACGFRVFGADGPPEADCRAPRPTRSTSAPPARAATCRARRRRRSRSCGT